MVSEKTIEAIQKVITGDWVSVHKPAVAPYRTGPEILRFFNEFGFNDVYSGSGGKSRWMLAEERVRSLVGTPHFEPMVAAALDPAYFQDHNISIDTAVDYVRRYLERDGWSLLEGKSGYVVRRADEGLVSMEARSGGLDPLSHEFIHEHVEKSETRLLGDDFTGAITSARTLVETVLQEMERRAVLSPPPYNGELGQLMRRVQIALNIDPKTPENQPFHLVLTGLTNIVSGLAPIRNRMSDSHPLLYRPARRHAKLVVNAAKTVCDFLLDTFEAQVAAGKILPVR